MRIGGGNIASGGLLIRIMSNRVPLFEYGRPSERPVPWSTDYSRTDNVASTELGHGWTYTQWHRPIRCDAACRALRGNSTIRWVRRKTRKSRCKHARRPEGSLRLDDLRSRFKRLWLQNGANQELTRPLRPGSFSEATL